jgi:TonB family protein
MKSIIFLLLISLVSFSFSFAQTKDEEFTKKNIKMPSVIKMGKIIYPETDKKGNVQGKIYLKVLVDIQGKAANTELLKKEGGSDEMVKSAMEAAKNTTFKPGIDKKTKKPVECWVTIPYQFKLK